MVFSLKKGRCTITIGLLFWIVFIICLLLGGFGVYRLPAEQRMWGGSSLAVFILIGLLGWAVFGSGK